MYIYIYVYILIVIHDNVIFWDFQSHGGAPKSLTFWAFSSARQLALGPSPPP